MCEHVLTLGCVVTSKYTSAPHLVELYLNSAQADVHQWQRIIWIIYAYVHLASFVVESAAGW